MPLLLWPSVFNDLVDLHAAASTSLRMSPGHSSSTYLPPVPSLPRGSPCKCDVFTGDMAASLVLLAHPRCSSALHASPGPLRGPPLGLLTRARGQMDKKGQPTPHFCPVPQALCFGGAVCHSRCVTPGCSGLLPPSVGQTLGRAPPSVPYRYWSPALDHPCTLSPLSNAASPCLPTLFITMSHS